MDASQFVVCSSVEHPYIAYCLIRGTVRLLTAALNIDVFVRNQSNSLTVIAKSVCMRFFSLYLSMIPKKDLSTENRCCRLWRLVNSVLALIRCQRIRNIFSRNLILIRTRQGRRIVNDSRRVACCTRLYNDGFDEQSVVGRSGHRNNAAQLYKRPCLEQEKSVSFALDVLKSDALTECQVKEKSPTFVKEETARVPAINAIDVKIESDCVRIELPVNISK